MTTKIFTLLLGLSFSGLAGGAIEGENLLVSRQEKIIGGAKGTVVVFLSARCPCSDSHIPILKELAKDFPEFSYVAIHANANEPKDEAKKYFEGKALPFPVIEDSTQDLANDFKALKTPHAFVFSPQGQVLYRGGVTDSAHAPSSTQSYLREALKDISENRPVKVALGRALGCYITRRK